MMAHYAFLNEDNVVTEIIVGLNENETQIDVDGTVIGGSAEAWETYYGNVRNQNCKRTSVNAKFGKKIDPETRLPVEPEEVGFRKNYAQIDGTYNAELDAFLNPKPFPSWILNEENCRWEAPIRNPQLDNPAIDHHWDEDVQNWVVTPADFYN